jgi:hypothetical protein
MICTNPAILITSYVEVKMVAKKCSKREGKRMYKIPIEMEDIPNANLR